MNGYRTMKTYVSILGSPEDYLNLPVVKNGNAIGVITGVKEIEGKYELTLVVYTKFEFMDGKVSAVILE